MRHLLLATALLATPAFAASGDGAWHAKARDLFAHAIEIPTVAGRGKVPELANYLAAQYRAAGWAADDIHVMPYEGNTGDRTAAAPSTGSRGSSRPRSSATSRSRRRPAMAASR